MTILITFKWLPLQTAKSRCEEKINVIKNYILEHSYNFLLHKKIKDHYPNAMQILRKINVERLSIKESERQQPTVVIFYSNSIHQFKIMLTLVSQVFVAFKLTNHKHKLYFVHKQHGFMIMGQ